MGIRLWLHSSTRRKSLQKHLGAAFIKHSEHIRIGAWWHCSPLTHTVCDLFALLPSLIAHIIKVQACLFIGSNTSCVQILQMFVLKHNFSNCTTNRVIFLYIDDVIAQQKRKINCLATSIERLSQISKLLLSFDYFGFILSLSKNLSTIIYTA